MASDIKIRIEGDPLHGGNVRVDDFVGVLKAFKRVLVEMDRAVGDDATLEFLVTHLDMSSPATITFRAEGDTEKAQRVVGMAIQGVNKIERGEPLPDEYGYDALNAIRNLGKYRDRLTSMTLTDSTTEVTVTKGLPERVANVLGEDQFCYGSMTGALDTINVHDNNKFFVLYPAAGPKSVKCAFPEELKERAKGLIESWVTVSGMMRYKARCVHPLDVRVQEMEEHKSSGPSLSSLYGKYPDMTGEESSEDFIDRVRDGG